MQTPYNNSFEACQLNFWPLRHKVDNTKPYCQKVNFSNTEGYTPTSKLLKFSCLQLEHWKSQFLFTPKAIGNYMIKT